MKGTAQLLEERPLRYQLTLSVALLLTLSLASVAVGTYLFVSWGEARMMASLSAEARDAYDRDWVREGLPEPHLVEEISLAEEALLRPVYEAEFGVVLALSVLALLVCLPLTTWLARRLADPLVEASRVAEQMAQGAFEHRAQLPQGSSQEIVSLTSSLNRLAGSLEEMRENVHFQAASIAHEIRTPLTVIQGYLQAMRDGVVAPDNPHLDRMLVRMDGLSRLLQDLQTLELAHAGTLRLERNRFDLQDALRELVAWRNDQAPRPTVRFEAPTVGEGSLIVELDRQRVEQAALALIDNALRHGAPRGKVIVRTGFTSKDRIEVGVFDEGPGFSKLALDRAAERFWSQHEDDAHGSGLGLSVAKAIAEAHGGDLHLANLETGGAAASLVLPFDRPAQPGG